MAENQGPPEWRVIGETVPGASHLRAGIPNQDSILQVRASGRGLPLVLSVSDGHGSNKCFRSDRGSRYAVKQAAQLVGEFLDERRGHFDLAEIESGGREFLPREFAGRWREAVEADLKARPFLAAELETLVKKDGERARRLVEANPLLAYGATSLTVAVEESFVLYLQLGDGDILTVSEAGEVARPLPEDARLFANETTSLCSPDAEKDFRFHVQQLTGTPPALILLSTDGYVNSFADEAGFLKVGGDLLEMLRADGFDFVNSSLKGWLEEATQAGSGDDTTLGIVCRMDALKRPAPAARPTRSRGSAAEGLKRSRRSREAGMGYAHRVEGEGRVELKDFDPAESAGLKRAEGEQQTAELIEELVELQELLYAARRQSVLVVLQGRDTSGKDGTIRHVTGPLDSQGCEVSSFKVPTPEELAHDFLWRVHARTPARGYIKIFNRSHYEDVLVARVHRLVPEEVWRARYRHINDFESLLADSKTIILKFYLHISREEQEGRLRKREADPTKYWKLSVGDWKERERWGEYTAAYEDAINLCRAPHAPWFVVPADRKWFRNLAVAEALRDALRPHREDWLRELEEVGRREKKAIEEYLGGRGGGAA